MGYVPTCMSNRDVRMLFWQLGTVSRKLFSNSDKCCGAINLPRVSFFPAQKVLRSAATKLVLVLSLMLRKTR